MGTVPEIRGEMKESSGEGNSSVVYLIHISTFVNAKMYPHPAYQQ
jgi:hypothetical protein